MISLRYKSLFQNPWKQNCKYSVLGGEKEERLPQTDIIQ